MAIPIEDKQKETKKMYIVLIIGALLMLIIGQLPPFGQVTIIGMRLLGIFIGCIFTWFFGYLSLGSIMGIAFFALYVPGNTGNVAFPSAFGNYNLVMIFFCLIFCYGLQKCGVLSYVARLILSIRFARKGPWHLALVFWIASIACSAIVTNSLAAAVLMFGIFYEVADKLQLPKRSHFTAIVMIISATFCSLCIAMMPYSPALWVPIGMMQAVAPHITAIPIVKICLLNWLLVFVTLMIAAILLKILLAFGVIQPNFTLAKDFVIVEKEELIMTKNVKWGLFYIAVIMVLMVGASVIPASHPVGAFLSRVGTIGCFLVVCLMMCLTTIDGERMMTFEDAVRNGVPWGLYFMLLAALTIAGNLGTEAAGISATISAFAATHLGGASVYIFALSLLAFTLVLTNCINNAVAQQLAIPIMTTLLLGAGINPIAIIGMATIVVEHGNILPSGSPVGALMHGNPEWLSSGQVYLYAAVGSLCALLAIAICLPLGFVLI